MDVEAVLEFSEKLVERPKELSLQSSLEQIHRLQRVFFPDGLTFTNDGSGTAASNSFFNALQGFTPEKQLWRPRRDSNPCYRRESLRINRNCKKTKAQEAVGKAPYARERDGNRYSVGTREIVHFQVMEIVVDRHIGPPLRPQTAFMSGRSRRASDRQSTPAVGFLEASLTSDFGHWEVWNQLCQVENGKRRHPEKVGLS
jgi:hypothetical protein